MATEKVLSLEAMATRSERQDFFENAADGMAIIDDDGCFLDSNKEARRLLGRDDLHNTRIQGFLVDRSARLWPEVTAQIRRDGSIRCFDLCFAVAGKERILSFSAGVGCHGMLMLSFRDVTELRDSECELRTTKDFLENLIDNSVDAIIVADMNGDIMLFNKGAEVLYGYAANDVISVMNIGQLHANGGANEVMTRLREEHWGGRGRLAPERREILTSRGVVSVSMTASIIYEDGEEVATVSVLSMTPFGICSCPRKNEQVGG